MKPSIHTALHSTSPRSFRLAWPPSLPDPESSSADSQPMGEEYLQRKLNLFWRDRVWLPAMSRISTYGCYFIFIFCSLKDVFSYQSYVSNSLRTGRITSSSNPRIGSVKLSLVENSLLTLTAGAIAGSIGVGVAYPLDALKTKAQTYASSQDSSAGTENLAHMDLNKFSSR